MRGVSVKHLFEKAGRADTVPASGKDLTSDSANVGYQGLVVASAAEIKHPRIE